MRKRHHRLRIALGIVFVFAAPLWCIGALLTGGSLTVPLVMLAQVVYYLVKGFREGLHRDRGVVRQDVLRLQERLTRECVRLHGGFHHPFKGKIEALGFPTDTVTRL